MKRKINLKKFNVMVWEDYQITNTYWVDVIAETEEKAMEIALQKVKNGEGGEPSRGEPMELKYEANDNVTVVDTHAPIK